MKKRFKTDARVWGRVAVSMLAGAIFSVFALAAAALLHAQSSLLRVGIGAVIIIILVFIAAWLAIWEKERRVLGQEYAYSKPVLWKVYLLIGVATAAILAPFAHMLITISIRNGSRVPVFSGLLDTAGDAAPYLISASAILAGFGLIFGGGVIVVLLGRTLQVLLESTGRQIEVLQRVATSDLEGIRYYSSVASTGLSDAISKKSKPVLKTLPAWTPDEVLTKPAADQGELSKLEKALREIRESEFYRRKVLVLDMASLPIEDRFTRFLEAEHIEGDKPDLIFFVRESRDYIGLFAYALRKTFLTYWRELPDEDKRRLYAQMKHGNDFFRDHVDRSLYRQEETQACAPLLAFPVKESDTVWQALYQSAGRNVGLAFIVDPRTGWPDTAIRIEDIVEWTNSRAVSRFRIAHTPLAGQENGERINA